MVHDEKNGSKCCPLSCQCRYRAGNVFGELIRFEMATYSQNAENTERNKKLFIDRRGFDTFCSTCHSSRAQILRLAELND